MLYRRTPYKTILRVLTVVLLFVSMAAAQAPELESDRARH